MTKTILNIKIHYDTFSKAEKKIADFLMQDPTRVLPLFITELAEKSGTSEATVVRFAKRLGFEGYQQLKIAIAQDTTAHPINENITKSDKAGDIFQKVCDDIYCSLEKTRRAIDGDALERCCEALLGADSILICGLGNSAAVAIDASHKLLRLGLNAHAYTDNHMQAIAAAHTDAKSVLVGISHSGSSKDIIQAMELARQNGATTVAVTNLSKSPIDKVSDIVLCTVSDETNYRILGLSSRIAQLAIIDTIYSFLVCHLENSTDAIAQAELALKPKKV
ncbi:MAG: MurR/RpiR family transcriptional regulator [Candidatus Neoclostridium sp.]